VLTVTSSHPTPRTEYVLRAAAWVLAIFCALRLTWIEQNLVLPATRLQAALAAAIGTPTAPIQVTIACSATDALALCLGAVLAFPVPWITRLAAAAGGTVLLLALNTARIGSLGVAAASPAWFDALHLYIWPAALTVGIAIYVFTWMRFADGQRPITAPMSASAARRFAVLTIVFGLAFVVLSPLVLQGATVLRMGGVIARAAAATLSPLGITATAAGNILWTPWGGFMVTQECISTPFMPVYLAALVSFARRRWQLLLGVVAFVPLFTVLGILRLLLVALPGSTESSLFAVHAFYQMLLGAMVVVAAAVWRYGRGRGAAFAAAGLCVGVLFLYLFGSVYSQVVTYRLLPIDDPQGAIAFLPAFQTALYLALSTAAFAVAGWRALLGGFVGLACTQAAGMLLLHLLIEQAGLLPHVAYIRGWAIVAPVLTIGIVAHVARPRV
jgi:exosortase/archaeosortase family protein